MWRSTGSIKQGLLEISLSHGSLVGVCISMSGHTRPRPNSQLWCTISMGCLFEVGQLDWDHYNNQWHEETSVSFNSCEILYHNVGKIDSSGWARLQTGCMVKFPHNFSLYGLDFYTSPPTLQKWMTSKHFNHEGGISGESHSCPMWFGWSAHSVALNAGSVQANMPIWWRRWRCSGMTASNYKRKLDRHIMQQT